MSEYRLYRWLIRGLDAGFFFAPSTGAPVLVRLWRRVRASLISYIPSSPDSDYEVGTDLISGLLSSDSDYKEGTGSVSGDPFFARIWRRAGFVHSVTGLALLCAALPVVAQVPAPQASSSSQTPAAMPQASNPAPQTLVPGTPRHPAHLQSQPG
jgi:hypothetical protein